MATLCKLCVKLHADPEREYEGFPVGTSIDDLTEHCAIHRRQVKMYAAKSGGVSRCTFRSQWWFRSAKSAPPTSTADAGNNIGIITSSSSEENFAVPKEVLPTVLLDVPKNRADVAQNRTNDYTSRDDYEMYKFVIARLKENEKCIGFAYTAFSEQFWQMAKRKKIITSRHIRSMSYRFKRILLPRVDQCVLLTEEEKTFLKNSFRVFLDISERKLARKRQRAERKASAASLLDDSTKRNTAASNNNLLSSSTASQATINRKSAISPKQQTRFEIDRAPIATGISPGKRPAPEDSRAPIGAPSPNRKNSQQKLGLAKYLPLRISRPGFLGTPQTAAALNLQPAESQQQQQRQPAVSILRNHHKATFAEPSNNNDEMPPPPPSATKMSESEPPPPPPPTSVFESQQLAVSSNDAPPPPPKLECQLGIIVLREPIAADAAEISSNPHPLVTAADAVYSPESNVRYYFLNARQPFVLRVARVE